MRTTKTLILSIAAVCLTICLLATRQPDNRSDELQRTGSEAQPSSQGRQAMPASITAPTVESTRVKKTPARRPNVVSAGPPVRSKQRPPGSRRMSPPKPAQEKVLLGQLQACMTRPETTAAQRKQIRELLSAIQTRMAKREKVRK